MSGDANQDFTLTVDETPVITSASSTTFTAGQSDSFTVQSDGYPTDTTSLSSGSLPSGVTFGDNGNGTATLAGTPATGTGGTYNLGFTASNGVGSGSQSFGLTVDEAPAITSADAAPFTVGSSGAFAVLTTGFPAATVTESGTLPSGITFTTNSDGTPELVGTPNTGTAGDYDLTFTASNGIGTEATQDFTLVVGQAPAFTSADQTAFTMASSGTFQVTTIGFPAATLSESGTLPAGVSFVDNGDGTATLSGTPTVGTCGNYGLTITASNGFGADASQDFILAVGQAPAITSADNATFVTQTADSFLVTTIGYPAPAFTESGILPSGVTFIDNGDGTATLSGTPAAGTQGSYAITITAGNEVGSDAVQNFTLTIEEAPAIDTDPNTDFVAGNFGSFTIWSSGSPTPALSEAGTLPTGIRFSDNGNGSATFWGTPDANTDGTYDLTVTASNGVGQDATQSFILTVDPAPAPAAPTITSASDTEFAVGTLGTFSVLTDGFPNPSLSETGSLPTGVVFTDNGDETATLSGTPVAGSDGTYTFTINATNGVGTDATQSFTLTVNPARHRLLLASLPVLKLPLRWAISGRSL